MRQVTIQCRTRGIRSSGRQECGIHKSKRDRAHARFVWFLSPLTRNLGDGRGLLLRDNMYKVSRKGTESAGCQVHHVVAPTQSCPLHRMSQLRGRWLLPLPVKVLITSNLISTRRARLIYPDDGPPFNLGGEPPWPGLYTHWPAPGPFNMDTLPIALLNTCPCADRLNRLHANAARRTGCTLHTCSRSRAWPWLPWISGPRTPPNEHLRR